MPCDLSAAIAPSALGSVSGAGVMTPSTPSAKRDVPRRRLQRVAAHEGQLEADLAAVAGDDRDVGTLAADEDIA